MRKLPHVLTALLVAAGLTVVSGGGAHAAPLTARWCGTGVATPCTVSFTRNGVDQNGANDLVVQTTTELGIGGGAGHYFTFLVAPDPGAPTPGAPMSESDQLAFTLDTGAFHPDYISGFEGQEDVDVFKDPGSGHWMLRIKGHPVLQSAGCNSDAAWPWPCPDRSTADTVTFEGDVNSYNAGVNEDFVGFYAGTNVTYNGIFFNALADGTRYLEMEAVAPRLRADGTTPVVGSVHFRVPFVMLKEDFGIPDPASMTTGGLTGTVNDGKAVFNISMDPDGGGLYVDVSGFTFPPGTTARAMARAATSPVRTIRVRTGVVTPTRPVITSIDRTSATRGVIKHSFSLSRGARPTGYVARCDDGTRVVKAVGLATSHRIVVTGLRRGFAYSCKVAATSKLGNSRWSEAKRMPRH